MIFSAPQSKQKGHYYYLIIYYKQNEIDKKYNYMNTKNEAGCVTPEPYYKP